MILTLKEASLYCDLMPSQLLEAIEEGGLNSVRAGGSGLHKVGLGDLQKFCMKYDIRFIVDPNG